MIIPLLQSNDAAGAAGAGIGLLFFLVYFAVLAVFVVSFWRISAKMGDPGWMGIVPILNIYRIFQRSRPDQAVLFTILSIVPCVSFVMIFFLASDLGKLFGKSFIHGFIHPLIGFGSAHYQGLPPPQLGA